MVMRHLRAKGFRMQRQKARDSMLRVDSEGVLCRARDNQVNLVEECMMLRARTMFGT